MMEERNLEGREAKGPAVEKAFCCRRGRCPTLKVEGKKVTLGGKEEGYTHWTQDNLADFVNAAKRGEFDDLIG